MSRQERTPPHDAEEPPTSDAVVDKLFAAGLEVHQALRRVGDDTAAGRHLRSVLARLDETITTVQRAGLAYSTTAGPNREALVTNTFVALARALAGAFDVTDQLSSLAQHGTELPDVQAAAFIVGQPAGTLPLTVAAPDQPALRELCRLRPSPAWDTCMSGQPQTVSDLTTDIRWPLFAARASAAGHRAVHTMPLVRRENVLGALALFRATPGTLAAPDGPIAQALADLATISVLVHHHPASELVADPARIHQAEGILAERHHIPVADAATAMATYARRHHRRLPDLARAVINGTADLPRSMPW